MIEFILFSIGIYMLISGRFSLGNRMRQGRPVRAVGILLMLPFGASLLFFGIFASISGNWSETSRNAFATFIGLTQLLGIVLVMLVSWGMLRGAGGDGDTSPSEARRPRLRLWQQLEKITRAAQQEASPHQPEDLPQSSPISQRFPSVMNTRQAAAYLKVPEQTIIELITSGKLIAARINHRYNIARSVLDDYRDNQESNS